MELSQQQRLIHVDHNRFAIFDRQLIVSRKRYKVETLCYNVIGKSYVAYRMMLSISYIPHLILLWLCCRLFYTPCDLVLEHICNKWKKRSVSFSCSSLEILSCWDSRVETELWREIVDMQSCQPVRWNWTPCLTPSTRNARERSPTSSSSVYFTTISR